MTALDRTVAKMMSLYGTTAFLSISVSQAYNPATSENVTATQDIPVNAMFFDYIRKTEGEGTEGNTLVKSGDKQVYIQPPQKTADGQPLPPFAADKDYLKINGEIYKIVTIKQLNPSLTTQGCILYELYVRK